VRTVAPTIINRNPVLVDSNPERISKSPMRGAAEQARIKERARAKIAAAHERIERASGVEVEAASEGREGGRWRRKRSGSRRGGRPGGQRKGLGGIPETTTQGELSLSCFLGRD